MFDFLHKKAQDATPPALPEGTVRRRYSIEGQVQGVGFRYRARYAAQTLELTGWVENEDDGSVTLEVQGDPEKFLRLFAMIQKSDYIQITGIRQKDLPPDPLSQSLSALPAPPRGELFDIFWQALPLGKRILNDPRL